MRIIGQALLNCFGLAYVFFTILIIQRLENYPLLLIIHKIDLESFAYFGGPFFLGTTILFAGFLRMNFYFFKNNKLRPIICSFISVYILIISSGIIPIASDGLNALLFIIASSFLLYHFCSKISISENLKKVFHNFVLVLSLTSLIHLVFFYFSTLSSLSKQEQPSVNASVKHQHPVILIILDEVSNFLLRTKLDKYPNIAKFSDTAINFKNAMSYSDTTYYSIPAIVSSDSVEISKLPHTADYPNNLFNIFKKSKFNVYSFEPITALCKQCYDSNLKTNMFHNIELLKDLAILTLKQSIPAQYSEYFPNLENKLNNFSIGTWQSLSNDYRVSSSLEYINSFKPEKNKPFFLMFHLFLPHAPYSLDKSCQSYVIPNDEDELGDGGKWHNNNEYVFQFYERFSEQMQCADNIIGSLFKRLKDLGLYESSLIVLTADHGVHFAPNQNRRIPDPNNYKSIFNVPLIIKLPMQKTLSIDNTIVHNDKLDDVLINYTSNSKIKTSLFSANSESKDFFSAKLKSVIKLKPTIVLESDTNDITYYSSLNNLKDIKVNEANKETIDLKPFNNKIPKFLFGILTNKNLLDRNLAVIMDNKVIAYLPKKMINKNKWSLTLDMTYVGLSKQLYLYEVVEVVNPS